MLNATLQHEPSETHDYPGRWRLVIDNDSTAAQRGLLVAARSRTYSAAATARLTYEAELLTPMGGAAIATLSGASGGGSNNVISATLTTQWQAVLSSKILASGLHMTHVGTYRVWARIYDPAAAAGDVDLRLEYFAGDPSRPTLGPIKTTKTATSFSLVDLGQVTISRVPTGPQRWEWRILSKGTTAGVGLRVDKVWILPVEEVSAKVIASMDLPAPTSFSARDEFNQTAGALTAKTLPVGGTWAGAGDADDFSVETAGKTAQRTAVSDAAGFENGRFAIAGTSVFTNVLVGVNVKFDQQRGQEMGVFARYTDPSNFLLAYISAGSVEGSSTSISLLQRIAGVTANLADLQTPLWVVNTQFSVRLMALASGMIAVWAEPASQAAGPPLILHSNAATATGGALASGKAGFFDQSTSASAATRNYDDFTVSVPEADAVLHPSRSAELRSDGYYRQDAAGVAYSEIPVLGDLPRTPPAGTEGRTLEVLVKGSRGDFESIADSGMDDISARLYTRPSWLFLPEP